MIRVQEEEEAHQQAEELKFKLMPRDAKAAEDISALEL